MFNQSHGGANHSRIKVGHSWTARSVIQEQQQEEINRIVRKEFGETLGTPGALRVYQRAVWQVWRQLSTEEQARVEETATSWNLEKGLPDSVKVRYGNTILAQISCTKHICRNATRHGEQLFREFTQEVWRACRMRVAFLAGWLDEKGEMVSCTCVQQWVFCSWSAGEVQEPVGEEEEGSAGDEQARANGKRKATKAKSELLRFLLQSP